MKSFFQTDEGWTGFILRITLGLVMLSHGLQKLLGWIRGHAGFLYAENGFAMAHRVSGHHR